MNYVKKIIVALSLLASVTCDAGPPGAKVVMLITQLGPDGGGGSGFEVQAPSGRIFTVSNQHVCESARHGFMLAYSQYRDKTYRLEIGVMDKEKDLCLLTAIPDPEYFTLGRPARPGQIVITMGHPGLGPLTISAGVVTYMEAGEVFSSAKVAPGSSGGPLLDRHLSVVGVVYQYETRDNSSISISVEQLKAFLKGF